MMGGRILSALEAPDRCLEGLWRRVPKHIRLTFAAAVVLGLAVHLYMFVNKLPNHDDIGHLFSADYGTASGRWLLPAVARLDGTFSIPWLIGIVSVLCLAGTACFTVSLLRIRRPLGCVAAAAVMVSFPTVTGTFTYMFTADAYFFSLMLAAFGAYAAVRCRWGILLGTAAITLSMGIYQSYLSSAAVLMVGALLFETLDGDASFKELSLKGLRLLAVLAAAVAAYMAIVHITTQRVALVDYMGISSMGEISLRDLPMSILKSYLKYVTFFLRDAPGYHFGLLKYAFIASAACSIVSAILLLRERRLGPARTALAVALAIAYPLAGDLIYIMVPGGEIHILMIYGLVYVLIAPIALADYMGACPERIPAPSFQAAANWIVLLTMTLTAYSYALTANNAYLKIDLSMRQCTAYSIRLLDKIESCPGYHQGMPVVLLGSGAREEALSPTPQMDAVRILGVFDMASFRASYTYGHFLRYYLGFTEDVYLGDSEKARAMAEMPCVQDMPLYPEAGSIQIVDGAVVVKLNETGA